jgi:ankyrin repeat protein
MGAHCSLRTSCADDFLELKVAIQMALTKRNSDALSGMTYAASEGDVETVKHLLQRGLPVNSSDYDLRTTLHLAAAEGNVRVVELLVEEGADINVQVHAPSSEYHHGDASSAD